MIEECNKFGANMINDYNAYEELGQQFNINLSEIIQIDLNRSGVYL